MRLASVPLVAALCCGAVPVAAETISAEIGRTGLSPTATRLAALPAPTDADRFALAGVRFLGTVESALQLRWQAGLTESMAMLPFLRIPIPENPTPAGATPALVATLFRDVATNMDAARAPLSAIPDTSEFKVEIALADLWFDINANTTRDPGEDVLEVLGPILLGWQWMDRDPAAPTPVIRFDAADARWLSAYTHLLGGVAETLLAYDPTEPITRVMQARAALDSMGTVTADMLMGGTDAPDSIDLIAIVLATLNQTPDGARMTSAHAHFLAMVADNRSFWSQVATETDNDLEWLPSDRQQSALGIDLPQGTGAVWSAVLADLENMLEGRSLVPYWRIDGAGVNVARMFTDPRPIDVAGWIQGWAALPYLEQGPVITSQSWQAFEAMMGGQAMLFSLYLN